MAVLTHRSEGPPYILNQAQIGGIPTVSKDVPPLIVFLLLFSASAITSIYPLLVRHYRLHRQEREEEEEGEEEDKRRDRFPAIIELILFLFSGERVLACMLRITWAYHLVNVRLAVAVQIFMQAGVLLLYLMNLLFAKRICVELLLSPPPPPPGRSSSSSSPQAQQQQMYRPLKTILTVLSAFTVASLVMVITAIILSVYTSDQGVIASCRDVERAGAAYFVVVAAMPIILLLIIIATRSLSLNSDIPTMGFAPVERSSQRQKMGVVILSSLLCLLNAGFKAGVVWAPARALFNPAWYHSRTCLYVFVFTTEFGVLLLFYLTRVDLVFQSQPQRPLVGCGDNRIDT